MMFASSTTATASARRHDVHRPVLAAQVLEMLRPKSGDVALDLTLGSGGHAALLVEQVRPGGFLFAVDRDAEIAAMGVANLEGAGWQRGADFEVSVTRFSQARGVCGGAGADVVLADLGVSSFQLDEAVRGFSFRNVGPLDMRMSKGSGATAADIVNTASAMELERIFREYGEERWARRIALMIVERRGEKPYETTHELRDTVAAAIPRKAWPPNVDVATRVFQALRIAVNEELQELDDLLAQLPQLLRKNGSRAGIISFHSLEDRRVKQAFRRMAMGCRCPKQLPVCVCGSVEEFRLLSPGGLTAAAAEVAENPRARSARLRGIERIAGGTAQEDFSMLNSLECEVS